MKQKNVKINYSGKGFIYALVATLLMMLYAQFVLGHYSQCFVIKNEYNSLGLRFSYTLNEAMAFFSIRSENQLICYGNFIRVWDSIFPVFYTAMHLFWLRYLFKGNNILLIIPILHMCSDWIENNIELLMLEAYLKNMSISKELTNWGSVLTSLKWTFSITIYILITFGIIRRIVVAYNSAKQN